MEEKGGECLSDRIDKKGKEILLMIFHDSSSRALVKSTQPTSQGLEQMIEQLSRLPEVGSKPRGRPRLLSTPVLCLGLLLCLLRGWQSLAAHPL